jgi:D-glucuronyl C5-epimerase-like protein
VMRLALGIVVALLALAPGARAFVVADGAPPRTRLATPDPATLRGAVTRAWMRGDIELRRAKRWRAVVVRARETVARLEGPRQAELAAVLAGVERLAASGQLTPSRMRLAFLTVRRNTLQWRARAFPAAAGERVTYGGDPAVFQYFPGQGMQFHALATAGSANAMAKACEEVVARERAREAARRARRAHARALGAKAPVRAPSPSHGGGCHRARLAAALDRLVYLASWRGPFLAWEYRFDFGGGTAPWVSAMSQATAAQALARGARLLGDPQYKRTALAALGAFDAAPPLGVSVPSGDGREYLMYSFSPGLHILNGFLQSVIGLHDVAELTGSARAARLYGLGERTARRSVAAYDTGAWSRYSLAGAESTLSYHQLVTGFADGLCERTGDAVYCDAARRFTRYLHEPPRIEIDAPQTGHEDRATGFAFWISKVSDVRWSVGDRHGSVASYSLSVPRGSYPVTWTPPRGGTFRIRVWATGPEGRRGYESAVVRVRHTRVPCRSTSPRRPRGCTPKSKRSTKRSSRR